MIAVSAFLIAWLGFHWWHGIEASRADDAALQAAYDQLDATARNKPFTAQPYHMPLPAAYPFLAAVGVGVAVFVIGLLVVIAMNTDRSASRREREKPPATS